MRKKNGKKLQKFQALAKKKIDNVNFMVLNFDVPIYFIMCILQGMFSNYTSSVL